MDDKIKPPVDPRKNSKQKITRGIVQSVGGAIPIVGGVVSAITNAWSEHEQEKMNKFLEHWVQMLQDEMEEKEQTILEIMQRIDLKDEKVADRVESSEYQSLIKKTFRDWSGAESDDKRTLLRNILANAAATDISSDDVIRMFLEWINTYSVMHFQVIGAIYNAAGITRAEIWSKIGKGDVREDSADADLYKLLIRDLSIGSIIRQHREVDRYGNFIPKTAERKPRGRGKKPPVSAFDDNEGYELTGLGQQFVHYAMTDLPLKISFEENNE